MVMRAIEREMVAGGGGRWRKLIQGTKRKTGKKKWKLVNKQIRERKPINDQWRYGGGVNELVMK